MYEIERAKELLKQLLAESDKYPWKRQELILHLVAIAQAESLERIATHLGNIHQTLITPDVNGQSVGVADLLGIVASSLDIIVRDGIGDKAR